jgi:uridine kinase
MTVILIDGPSGSGKTELALRMRAGWAGEVRPTLLHLDDVYPGWDGLEAASVQITEHVLLPLREQWMGRDRIGGEHRAPRWQRYDWVAERAVEWHEIDPALPLIVEGCGALSRRNARLADIRIWVEADDAVRKDRALARDGDPYAREWDRWEAQWQAFIRRENPRALATLVVAT